MSESVDEMKRRAAHEAVEACVRSGMVVGLGTGSTAAHVTRFLGRKLAEGALRDILGVPTSEGTARAARDGGIPLTTLNEHPVVDVTIDGADEVDPELNLIKGLGGALLREKIVAEASREEIIVVDHGKLVHVLGARAPVPVEVTPFAQGAVARHLESLGARVTPRSGANGPFVTDEGNHILDCHFGAIEDPHDLAARIRSRAGVVEHGLFLGIVSRVFVAAPDAIRELSR